MAELNATKRADQTPSWQLCQGGVTSLLARIVVGLLFLLPTGLASAIEAIPVQPDQEKIDVTAKGEL